MASYRNLLKLRFANRISCRRKLSSTSGDNASQYFHPPPNDLEDCGSSESGWASLKTELHCERPQLPTETDCLIIGGGVMGSSVAYWLKQKNLDMRVTIVEKDLCYTRSSTVLSLGGIRHQFSLPENIQMSMFSSDFLKNVKQNLGVYDMDPPEIQFFERGYLFLASSDGAEQLHNNYKLQRELGADVQLFSNKELKHKWPWMNVDDLGCGVMGLSGEGWFDPWSLLVAFRHKNKSMGVNYVQGEVNNLSGETEKDSPLISLRQAEVKLSDESSNIKFKYCVNAAGPSAGDIAKLAGIGTGNGVLEIPLPVEPKKRFVFVVHVPKGPGDGFPWLFDPSGMYIRREGGANFICGMAPEQDQEPPADDLDVDYDFFENEIWPRLYRRSPLFESLKVKCAWSGFYDVNILDENLVIGNHPQFENFYLINGSSGHGIQHGPAAGLALAELMLDGQYKTINLSRLGFQRFIDQNLLYESNII